MKLKIKLLGKRYEFSGKSDKELLSSVKLPVIKGAATIEFITKGEERIKVLPRNTIQLLFGQVGRVGKEIALKRFKELFYA